MTTRLYCTAETFVTGEQVVQLVLSMTKRWVDPSRDNDETGTQVRIDRESIRLANRKVPVSFAGYVLWSTVTNENDKNLQYDALTFMKARSFLREAALQGEDVLIQRLPHQQWCV